MFFNHNPRWGSSVSSTSTVQADQEITGKSKKSVIRADVLEALLKGENRTARKEVISFNLNFTVFKFPLVCVTGDPFQLWRKKKQKPNQVNNRKYLGNFISYLIHNEIQNDIE